MTQNLPKPSEIIINQANKDLQEQVQKFGVKVATPAMKHFLTTEAILSYLDSQATQLNNYFICKEIHDSLPLKPWAQSRVKFRLRMESMRL